MASTDRPCGADHGCPARSTLPQSTSTSTCTHTYTIIVAACSDSDCGGQHRQATAGVSAVRAAVGSFRKPAVRWQRAERGPRAVFSSSPYKYKSQRWRRARVRELGPGDRVLSRTARIERWRIAAGRVTGAVGDVWCRTLGRVTMANVWRIADSAQKSIQRRACYRIPSSRAPTISDKHYV
ncbi:hypothetical protein FJT64_005183 [Amphibalanus amphitrite]|uniref:Uncharacterized protein n=1 Tax=Amphibalanus amphitrite TaxID=1232801 RepID=A0A6A4VUN1_AMPAM|nr:hypothetical protein FJT64_005183 [Amphibalanus amphitrite]